HRRQDDVGVELGELAERVRAQEDGTESERDEQRGAGRRSRHGDGSPPLDANPAGRAHDSSPSAALKPPRPSAAPLTRRAPSTARNTRCPVRIDHCGSSCAPTVCATPITIPPTSVPQSEPSPPMTTASKA